MPEPSPRQRWEAALHQLDNAELVAEPGAVETRFERARLLTLLGRDAEAQAAYIEILTHTPGHAGALNNLGSLLHARGYRSAAKTAYHEAVQRCPEQPMGHVNLGNVLGEEGAWREAREHYRTALRLVPDQAEAHRGLARAFEELGEPHAADRHRRRGFRDQPVTALPYRGLGQPITVLLLVAAGSGNVPLRHLLDDRVFRVFVVFAEFCDRQQPLPAHDLVINAIADADRCEAALVAAAALLASSTAPVINLPDSVRGTGRAAIARRLADVPGVTVPRVASWRREALAQADAAATLANQGFAFPLLLRSPGFHTGRHFQRVERAEELAAAVAELPGDTLLAIQYLDASGADGLARKYRVMFVDGRLYPLHLAISAQWMVHYFTAAMTEPAHRAADAAFLNDMAGVLGQRQVAALTEIAKRLGLDYGGIDFAIGGDGQVLLFEANAAMVVNPPDPGDMWAYRAAAVSRIHDAVRAMLTVRAGRYV